MLGGHSRVLQHSAGITAPVHKPHDPCTPPDSFFFSLIKTFVYTPSLPTPHFLLHLLQAPEAVREFYAEGQRLAEEKDRAVAAQQAQQAGPKQQPLVPLASSMGTSPTTANQGAFQGGQAPVQGEKSFQGVQTLPIPAQSQGAAGTAQAYQAGKEVAGRASGAAQGVGEQAKEAGAQAGETAQQTGQVVMQAVGAAASGAASLATAAAQKVGAALAPAKEAYSQSYQASKETTQESLHGTAAAASERTGAAVAAARDAATAAATKTQNVAAAAGETMVQAARTTRDATASAAGAAAGTTAGTANTAGEAATGATNAAARELQGEPGVYKAQ